MTDLHSVLAAHVENGSVPGAVGLVARGDQIEVAAVGSASVGGVPMASDPWNVPGRYGWVGGTGTSAHIVPPAGTVAILLAQVAADSPVPPAWMRDFWRYAAGAR